MSECVLGLGNTCHGSGDLLEVQVVESVNVNVLTYIRSIKCGLAEDMFCSFAPLDGLQWVLAI